MTISILIGGDLVPTASNAEIFATGKINQIIDESLLDILKNADVRVFNLEVPLTDTIRPINKCGPNLIASTRTINGIKALNPTILGLANNHITDQDEQGLLSTINLLECNNIAHVGVGEDLDSANKSYISNIEGRRIGFYACAENEFTIAEENKAGANPFDPLESLDHIKTLKSQCDYVIVLYHGGKEHYRYPSPYLQKVCRKIAQKGADLVVCQHSHCIGAYEKYADSTIVYGQGNFLFDYSNDENWQTSILIKVLISDKMTVGFVPICKRGHGVGLADQGSGEKIMNGLYERSKQILTPYFVKNEYDKYCMSYGGEYLYRFAGYNRIARKLDQILKGKLIKLKYKTKELTVFQGYIQCEAHRELILNFIKNKVNK